MTAPEPTAARHTAYHEAGHVVIARILDLPCRHASIETLGDPDEAIVTHGRWDVVAIWSQQEVVPNDLDIAAFANVMCVMAGWAAQTELLGSCHGDDSEEREAIARVLGAFLPTGTDIAPFTRCLQGLTDRLVWRHRETIRRVALLLLERRTLSEADVDAIIAPTP